MIASAANLIILLRGVLGFARGTGHPVVHQRNLLAADPCHHAAYEAVPLWHGDEQIEYPARDQSEIACVRGDVDVCHPPDGAIEKFRRYQFERTLAGTLATLAVDHIRAVVHQRHHVGQKLRRILQVGVGDEDAFAPAHAQSRGQRQLVPVISHQPDRHDARIICCGLGHQLPGAIVRTVVDEDDLVAHPLLLQDCGNPPQELRQHGFLVVAGRNDRHFRGCAQERHSENVSNELISR